MRTDKIKEELELSLSIAKGSLFKKPEFGHRFKELARVPASENTRSQAESFANEALQWMLDYKHLRSVNAVATYDRNDRLLVHVECVAYNGDVIEFNRFVEVGDVSNG